MLEQAKCYECGLPLTTSNCHPCSDKCLFCEMIVTTILEVMETEQEIKDEQNFILERND